MATTTHDTAEAAKLITYALNSWVLADQICIQHPHTGDWHSAEPRTITSAKPTHIDEDQCQHFDVEYQVGPPVTLVIAVDGDQYRLALRRAQAALDADGHSRAQRDDYAEQMRQAGQLDGCMPHNQALRPTFAHVDCGTVIAWADGHEQDVCCYREAYADFAVRS